MSHLLPVKPLSQMQLPGYKIDKKKIILVESSFEESLSGMKMEWILPLSGWQVPYSQSQVSLHFSPQLDFEHREEQFTPCQPCSRPLTIMTTMAIMTIMVIFIMIMTIIMTDHLIALALSSNGIASVWVLGRAGALVSATNTKYEEN